MTRLQGKVALITGASSQLGKEMIKLFTDNGAKVFAVDNTPIVHLLKYEFNDEIVTFEADVSVEEEINVVFRKCTNVFGRLDILCNNAGYQDIYSMLYYEYPNDLLEKVLTIYMEEAIMVLKEGIDTMLVNGGGSIINTCAIGNAFMYSQPSPYVQTKSGIVMMTKQAALKYGNKGIRVNSINPSISRMSSGRLASPIDIANVALFLASDESSFINGQDLIIDGNLLSISFENVEYF